MRRGDQTPSGDFDLNDFNYHSGTGLDFIGERIAPSEDQREPFALLAAPQALRRIRFLTTRYAPNHTVTIRCDLDGWSSDYHGTYRNDAWEFFFEIPRLSSTIQFKFLLDGQSWMLGPDLVIPTDTDRDINESSISFANTEFRFQHGYENMSIEPTKLAQEAVPRNTKESIQYDVIIIGSGIGGGTLADSLSDQGIKTLVLEAGGLRLPTHITNLPGDWTRMATHHAVGHFENEPGSDFLPGVHLSLGGRSVYWSGLIPRMHDWEMQFWPTEIRNYLPSNDGYLAAEAFLRKHKRLGAFEDQVIQQIKTSLPGWNVGETPRSDHQPYLDEAGNLKSITESSTGVFSTADLLLTSLANPGRAGRSNLTINVGHLVTHLETNGDRTTSVVCQDLIGNAVRRYRGRFVVLAAGSLESAKIALNSGLTDPNGKMGVGLTDHPAFFSAQYTIPDGNPLAGSENHAKVFLHKQGATSSDHPFNVEVLLNPIYWAVRNSDDDLLPRPNPSKLEMKFVFASQLDDGNYVHSQGVGKKLRVKVRRNDAGLPHFAAAQSIRNTILQSLNVPFTANEGMGYGNEGTVHHAGGTLRMSGNGTGVVNTDLKFESYDNLYCADPSIWPMIPAANPVLTLVALVQRLASHLKSRL
jgi:choline dehydrogenase-like flavoprotein